MQRAYTIGVAAENAAASDTDWVAACLDTGAYRDSGWYAFPAAFQAHDGVPHVTVRPDGALEVTVTDEPRSRWAEGRRYAVSKDDVGVYVVWRLDLPEGSHASIACQTTEWRVAVFHATGERY